jgi:hypothetical protein
VFFGRLRAIEYEVSGGSHEPGASRGVCVRIVPVQGYGRLLRRHDGRRC